MKIITDIKTKTADFSKKYFVKPYAYLPVYLFAYMMLWHFSIIFFGSNYSPAQVSKGLIKTILIYLPVNIISTGIIMYLLALTNKKFIKRISFIVFIILFFISVLIRDVDWGAVYYAGLHIDQDFWFHAFFADSTVFMRLKLSYILYGISAILVYLFYRILKAVKKAAGENLPAIESGDLMVPKKIPSRIILGTMGIPVLLSLVLIMILLPFRWSKNVPPDLEFLYAGIPEKECISSFYMSFFSTDKPMKNLPQLNAGLIEKLKKAGITLNTVNAEYPMLKKSIYLSPGNRGKDVPVIGPGTNIIIIFAESLSRFFLNDDVHGLKGIIDNVKDMEKSSFRVENMYNADYPTIRGLIASLSSNLYPVSKIGGDKGVWRPIMGKYLFITEILKKFDYTTIQIQGGSEYFVGMRDFFMKKQGYDQFVGYESLMKMKLSDLNVSFGKSDHDVFMYVKKWLEEYKSGKPFFMSVSTINLHSPYKPTHEFEKAGGNPMLNSLYSFDKAFGIFWEYLKNSKFSKNTVVIMTADHAIGTNSYISKFRSGFTDHLKANFDYIPFIIHFPGKNPWNERSISVNCTNLDITPTILDMMGIDLENPFIGLSIFSDRRKYPFPISVSPLYDRLTPDEAGFVKDIRWKGKDQADIINFFMSCVNMRRIVPDDFKIDPKYTRKR